MVTLRHKVTTYSNYGFVQSQSKLRYIYHVCGIHIIWYDTNAVINRSNLNRFTWDEIEIPQIDEQTTGEYVIISSRPDQQ